MTYARAGHTPLLHLPAGGGADGRARILAPDGMVLGLRIDDGERFAGLLSEVALRILPGDLFVFFTDGISEAMNERADCFGESQLAELVEEHGHLPIGELRERILREIAAFVGGAPQHDDMTMILLKVDAPVPAEAVS
jgi:serine phosphatase RsbU (regulator of sigma subunit)